MSRISKVPNEDVRDQQRYGVISDSSRCREDVELDRSGVSCTMLMRGFFKYDVIERQQRSYRKVSEYLLSNT